MPDAAGENAQEKRKKRRHFYRKKPKDTAPLPKLNMDAVPDYGEIAARLMAKMGFTEGMGLGKAGDGIREPVAVDVGQKKTGVGYVKPKRKRRRRKRDRVRGHECSLWMGGVLFARRHSFVTKPRLLGAHGDGDWHSDA